MGAILIWVSNLWQTGILIQELDKNTKASGMGKVERILDR